MRLRAPGLRDLMRLKGLFVTPEVRAYRDEEGWFIDDDNGFSKSDNELIAGIPKIIELMAGSDARRVRIRYSDRPFKDAKLLSLLHSNELGATYQYDDGELHEGWLCPVFFWYFKEAPARLYVRIRKA
ncbi:MAG TPA: DUF6717 family protein [Rectinemataceae bacterium]|nr:DUF6717 family protein [Rectinemataceae bacterium]